MWCAFHPGTPPRISIVDKPETMQRLLVYLLLALLVPMTATSGDLREALGPLMEGEFALQQGEAELAADAFARAAELSDDPVVAKRAVRVALAAKDRVRARSGLVRWTALAPDDEDILAATLRLALLDGQPDEARVAADALLLKDDGWRRLAAALVAASDPKQSGDLLGALLADAKLPDDMDAWLAFGGVALRLNDKVLYGRLAKAVAERFPAEPRALIWKAEDAIAHKDEAGARQALEAIQALPALTASESLAVAAQLNAIGDPAAAAKALADAGDDARVLTARAAYLSAAEDKAGLIELYAEAVAKTPEDDAPPTLLLLLGQLAELKEDTAAALGWYRQIQDGFQHEQAQLRIAVLLDRSGQHDAALDLLREIQASDTEWGEIVRDAYLLEAELARGRRDLAAEMGALNRGLEIFEDDAMLRYNRALAYERNDRVDEAIADLRALSAGEPENADWLNALGYTLVDRTDAYEEGLTLIQKAIALNPNSAAIQDSLGWALHRLGRDEEALPLLKLAFALQRDAEVAAHLASVLDALGQHEEARSILRLAHEMDPDSRALQRVLDALSVDLGSE